MNDVAGLADEAGLAVAAWGLGIVFVTLIALGTAIALFARFSPSLQRLFRKPSAPVERARADAKAAAAFHCTGETYVYDTDHGYVDEALPADYGRGHLHDADGAFDAPPSGAPHSLTDAYIYDTDPVEPRELAELYKALRADH